MDVDIKKESETIWLSRDSDDNRIWLHPYSKTVIHTYTDYEGVEHKRWLHKANLKLIQKCMMR